MAPVTAIRMVTVNAAFLQEIKEVNQDLWRLLADVRRMCHDPISIDAAPRRFSGLANELRDQLALHFALEEAYGYFEDPIDVAPRLCEQAASLRTEHQDLYLMIVHVTELAERLTELQRADGFLRDVVRRFAEFDERLQKHEASENELILQEYADDIGVGD